MSMSRKDYESVASVLFEQIAAAELAHDGQSVLTTIATAKALAVEFGKSNVRFDYWKFFTAATGTAREQAV